MNISLENVLQQCGLTDAHVQVVTGGDINHAYKIQTKATSFFLKVNDADAYPFMFQREADGLESLTKYSNCIVPEVIKTGVADDQQYLLLQWIERAAPVKNYYSSLGKYCASFVYKRSACSCCLLVNTPVATNCSTNGAIL